MEGQNVVQRLTKVESLLVAAARGHTRQVQQLLLEGVPLQTDQDGCTALHHAAVNDNTDIVSMLATYNSCLLEIKDKSGQTALHHGAVRGHVETVKTLLQLGSRPDRRCTDQLANTPLHLAAFHGCSRTVQQLIVHHADVQLTNKDGSTALHLAAQNGHNETSRLLLFAGCQPNVKNHYGDTALHTAARYGHAGVTGILINARCLVNLQNTNGDTALHISAALKRKKITRLLLDSGINASIKNKQNERAVDVARRKEHMEILEILAPKVAKNKRQSLAGQVKVASLEVLSSPPSTEKKKNKLLLFFSRKKKSKNVDDIELTSPTTSPRVLSPVEYQPTYSNGASYQLTRTNGVEYQPVYTTSNGGVDPLCLLRDFRSHLHQQASVTNGNESPGDVTSSQMHPSMYYINQSAAADTPHDFNRDTTTDRLHQSAVDRVWLRHSELHTTGSGHHGRHDNNHGSCRTNAMNYEVNGRQMNGNGSGQRSRCRPEGDEQGKLYRCRSDDTLSTVSAAESHHRVVHQCSNRTAATSVVATSNNVTAAAAAAAGDCGDDCGDCGDAVWTKLATNGHNDSSTLSADCQLEV